MASIANLIVTMGADVAGFETDMKRSSRAQAQRMKQMEQDARRAGVAIAAAFTAVAGAVTTAVVQSAKAADEMQKMALKTGISTEALSQYGHVAGLSGSSVEQFAKGVSKNQRSLVDASNGLATQQRAFDRLGLSVGDLMKMAPDKQFEEIAGAIAGLESATLRSATAQEIFGRAGTDLLPIMASGKKGILELREEADRLGLTIGQEFADDAALFNDNLDRMGALVRGASRSFTAGLLPALISLQTEFLNASNGATGFAAAGESLGGVIVHVARGVTLLWGLLKTVAAAMLGIAVTAQAALEAVIAPIKATLSAMADATQQIARGEFRAAWETLGSIAQRSGAEFDHALADMKNGIDEVTGAGVYFDQALAKSNRLLAESAKHATSTAGAYGSMEPVIDGAAKGFKGLEKAAAGFMRTAVANKKEIEAHVKALEEEIKAQLEYNEALQDFIDVGDPVAALVREFAAQVEFANKALVNKKITLAQYRDSLNALSDGLGKSAAALQVVAKESDSMTEAMLEGVRILERAFTSMWASIFDGSKGAFSGMLDGFKTMLGNFTHQLTTLKITEQLGNLIDPKKIFNARDFASGIAGTLGILIGTELGGGGSGAAIGSALGALAGSIIPGLGTLVGGAIGSILGGLLGGLFDSNRPSVLEASGFSKAGESGSDDDTSVDSIFGATFIRSRRLDEAAIADFKTALVEFDNAVGAFLDDSQIGAIATALEGWSEKIAGETLSAEELLNSRFATILTTFSADLQHFVNQASDLQEQVSRLQIGVGAEKLFAEQPEIFSGHTVSEFLAVVDAFQSGTESIVDAFGRVVALMDTVTAVLASLQDFSGSDLRSDYATLVRLQAESVVDTLSRMTSGLDDALRNFDGSPAQLVEIGNLALSVRQQELTALSLIDSVAKGLNANLDRLLADTQATISGPRKAEDILFDARALIDTVAQASTPEEIADIGTRFEALIRQLSPEDTKAFGSSTLAIIESFKAVSNQSLEQARQAVMDSGDAIRQMVEGFADLIDPLALIASTNDRAAAALEALSGGAVIEANTDAPLENAGAVTESINLAFQDALEDQSQVLATGALNMTNALSDGVSNMSRQLANAIHSGFAGANVTVNVLVQEPGLVTQ